MCTLQMYPMPKCTRSRLGKTKATVNLSLFRRKDSDVEALHRLKWDLNMGDRDGSYFKDFCRLRA